MKNLREKIGFGDIAVGIFLIVGLLWAVLWPVNQKFSVEVEYGEVIPGIHGQIFWKSEGADFSEKNSITYEASQKVNGSLGRNFENIDSLRIDPSNTTDSFSIRRVRYYINDSEIASYGYDRFMEVFTINNASYMVDEDNGVISITPANNDVNMVTQSQELSRVIEQNSKELAGDAISVRVAWILLFAVIGFVIVHKFGTLMTYFDTLCTGDNKWFNLSAVGLIIVSAVAVWKIAFVSELGVHPDEWDVVACLKYGMTHFFPPDIRDAEVAGTFSGYGYTKLENGTWYFLLFGKVAQLAQWLFGEIKWYRVPNVLLFLILVYLYCKNISKKNWLILSLGISVQAWYIFSYTTADAWDFFLAFLVLLQLTDEGSMLNKAIQLPVKSRNIFRHLILGVLFGMLFLGKQVYWAVLLLAFIVLLLKLIETPKEGKRRLLINYSVIIGFFCLTVVTRYGFDLYHYGLEGAEIKEALEIQYTDYDKNPTTPVEERCVTYHMYDNGKQFHELFEEKPDWFKDTYRSFCGLVADFETSDVYYGAIGVLYLFVYLCLAYFNLRKETPVKRKVEFCLMTSVMVMSLLASILNSYFIDCQTQGRYLLPMLMVAGYIGYKTPEAFSKAYFKLAVLGINLMSVWYLATRAFEMVTNL